MEFLEAMKRRYTTKMYDPERGVDTELIEQLKEVVRLSPSSINSQPWQFVFVSDPVLKMKLAQASYFNEEKIRQCHTLVVFTCTNDIPRFEQWMAGALPQGATDYYKQFIKPLDAEQIGAWLQRQVYIALGVLLSACATVGLDSSPMEGVEQHTYNQLLELDGYTTLCAVAIGLRDLSDYNQPALSPKSRRVATEVITVK